MPLCFNGQRGICAGKHFAMFRNDDGNGKQYSVNGLEYERRRCSMHTHIGENTSMKWVTFVYHRRATQSLHVCI